MVKSPLISVVIATYNGSETVCNSVESVMGQAYKNIEVIIVNDGSTDDTYEVLKRYERNDRVHVYQNSKNLGMSHSWNKGILYSSGEYIAIMDDDDSSHIDRFSKQIDFMLKNTDIDVLGSGAVFVDYNGKLIGEFYPPRSHVEIRRAFCFSNPIIHSTVLAKSSFFKLSSGYSENFRWKSDSELWGRSIKNFKFHNIQECLIDYKVREKKSLMAVPLGVYIRILNGFRLGCIAKSILYAVIYFMVEIARHFGYTQRKSKRIVG